MNSAMLKRAGSLFIPNNKMKDKDESVKIPLKSKSVRIKNEVMRKNGDTIVHVLAEADDSKVDDLALSEAFKPIFYFSMGFGLLWKRPNDYGKKCKCDFYTLHSCFLLIIIWFQAVKYIVTYEEGDTYGLVLFQKIITHIWAFQVALGITLYIYCKSKHVPAFLKLWENYKLQHGGLTLRYIRSYTFRRVAITNIFLVIMYVAQGTLLMIYTPKLYIDVQFPLLKFRPDSGPYHLYLFLYICFYMYTSLAWLQSALYMMCYCYLFKYEFRKLATEFSEEIHGKDKKRASMKRTILNVNHSHSSEDLKKKRSNLIRQSSSVTRYTFETEQYRQRYHDLCKLVRGPDLFLKYF